ncbi:MAG: hypothetical protein PW845_26690 [Pseudomonas sp.]|uniref:hypothetical protein n=1 Tax=Pseudomonas abieticivorans TaxID=2931382 RepID=UPI0020BE9CD1|nr:hypothetical protein [Pseudomonas sp. PIA16]MDE1168870.1 hypothetical protein [Pseudomonas sp.]
MPVKHDLLADLNLTQQALDQLSKKDDRLSVLLEAYYTIDREVLKAEAAAMNDDPLKKLKERRLLAKDKIVQQIDHPNTRGAAAQS